MSVIIDQNKCIGCASCASICPGNLIGLAGNRKAYLKRDSDCWHCTSCMKECRYKAIFFLLPPELDGQGSRMTVERHAGFMEWRIKKPSGQEELFVTRTDEANQY